MDLSLQFKLEDDQQSRKRSRVGEDSAVTKRENEAQVEELKRKLTEFSDISDVIISKERASNDMLQGVCNELIKQKKESLDENDELKRKLSEMSDIMKALIAEKCASKDQLQGIHRELLIKEKALKTLRKENEELKIRNADLLAKDRRSHVKLRRARKELLKGLNMSRHRKHHSIGIKKMGEIDANPFFEKVYKERVSCTEAWSRAFDQCSSWQKQIKLPNWNPFRIIGDDEGNLQKLVDEDDKELRLLKQEWGDEVYQSVLIALKELYIYNPNRRTEFPEIWNFNDNRRANLKEAIRFVFAELVPQKKLEKNGNNASLPSSSSDSSSSDADSF